MSELTNPSTALLSFCIERAEWQEEFERRYRTKTDLEKTFVEKMLAARKAGLDTSDISIHLNVHRYPMAYIEGIDEVWQMKISWYI